MIGKRPMRPSAENVIARMPRKEGPWKRGWTHTASVAVQEAPINTR
jgi:hypothetical protein